MFLRRQSGSVTVMRTAGFSFIEIIIAITIMAIFMTLGFMGVRKYVQDAKRLKTETALAAAKGLVQEFYDHTGVYPATLRDLATRPTDPKIAMRWRGPYAEEKEFIKGCFIDGWNSELQYQSTPGQSKEGRPFQLYSWGPKREGAPQDEWLDAWNY